MATVTYTNNIDDSCRTCLTDTTFKMYDIYEERSGSVNVAEMLSSCTSIMVSRYDRLPKQLCTSCYSCVVNFYDFKKLAEKIDNRLRLHFENQQTVTDNSISLDKCDQIEIKIENDNLESTADYDLEDDFHEAEVKQEDMSAIIELDNQDLSQVKSNLKYTSNDLKKNNDKYDTTLPLNLKPNPQKYKCVVCSETFIQHYKYVKHLVEHGEDAKSRTAVIEIYQNDKNQSFQCDVCGNNFTTINSLSAHKRKHTKVGRVLACSLCNKVFPKLSHLKRHELCHEHNRPYKCSMCKKSFATESVLMEHMNKHNGIKPYCCPLCSERFPQQSGLSNHIKVHTKEKLYLCSTCGKRFNSSTSLKQHLRRHSGIRKYACNMCPKRFVSKGELKTHNKIHTGERSYVCNICNATFTQSSALRNHSFVHLGIKPFHCDVCPMKFKSSYHLQRHYRIHSGERPYRCEICERAFTQSNDLEKHRRGHWGDDLYKCSQCSKSFRLKTELRQHISKHFVSSQHEALSVANNDIKANVVMIGDSNKQDDTEVQNKDIVIHVGNEQ